MLREQQKMQADIELKKAEKIRNEKQMKAQKMNGMNITELTNEGQEISNQTRNVQTRKYKGL